MDRHSGRCYRRRVDFRNAPLTVLGIEASCDDTAAALVRHVPGAAPVILSNVVAGQDALHEGFGGVVPEIAARAHAEALDLTVEKALEGRGLRVVDAVAVTAGPGLIGGVVAGVMLAKGIAAGAGLPLVGVNHLAGHALTPRLTDGLSFPYLMLLVSGGHCQFLLVRGEGDHRRLGGTIDDAPGEAFDKTARLLGLPMPGGPAVEREAARGTPRIALPRPLLGREGCDLSFSGLKTAVLRARGDLAPDGALREGDRADLCASFQAAVTEVLAEKSRRALRAAGPVTAFAVAGGVAANGAIRAALEGVAAEAGTPFAAPPPPLCTDNGAMIAWAGIEALRQGRRDDLTLAARPRWPLDEAAAPMLGSGKRGAKA
ncbi:O-sialoglycoprotein endopeptidase [Hasllibacter halocynthiae]|uniref:tRNA N6-adenosine threonylcarbamoyltransferase n=1 Tax=Hasllibacter halocynthiae TaxID=595589 RepID=A0A2T0X2K5_9RHOB|nr:tRNA (adenosine(37)-N6)-threonylcarbamoyltransferase complex transferase subunit TsaD [Hasllibacter halocynthiae]PRY93182.1 O-sialoglycoprotein endopeptidase [Hasllibacter halocynthiae]